jgi:CHAD domain-containing protein
MRDVQHISGLAAALRENVAKCAVDPDVDPVHDTRTGSRRLQATIENGMRELPGEGPGAAVREAAAATMQVLKRIRRAAGPVRDLDVHRKLLSKLTRRALNPEKARDRPDDPALLRRVPGSDVLESPQAGSRATPLEEQAAQLDAWLRHRRDAAAQQLQAKAKAALPKFDKRVAELEAAMRAKGLRRGRKKPPGVVALESFARLATQMQALHTGNLHDFRKGAKKARYVAELAESADREAGRVGETLKKLQDEIGDWHDWLVLAEEARAALGDAATELLDLVQAERERHFAAAMNTAAKLRGRLMGEWLAVGSRPVKPRRPAKTRPTENHRARNAAARDGDGAGRVLC